MEKHKMLLITTGGTIQGHVAAHKQDEHGIRAITTFAEAIQPTKNYYMNKWEKEIDVDLEELFPADKDGKSGKDSSDIVPDDWKKMCDLIVNNYDDYHSFIILHGTNTLGYTCAALSFSLANLGKPVVLTGSQVPTDMPGSDARMNLDNAIKVAGWPYSGTQVKGVVAVFGNQIITGTRVKKSTEFDYDAFKSFGASSIGKIGRMIIIDENNLKKHNDYLTTKKYNMAYSACDLEVYNDFDMRIVSLTEFPGMSKNIFRSLVENNDTKGFIFRAFGAGDVSHRLHQSFEYLQEMEIPIVVTTQAPNGNSNFQVNEPGQHLKKKELAIAAYDMSIEAQTVKLAWLLAKKKDSKIGYNYSDVLRDMEEDMHGEITVLKEQQQ